MEKDFFTNSMNLAKNICKIKLKSGDIAVDATMGKGNDTLFLANLVGEHGKVYAFDIQEEALKETKEKLKKSHMEDFVYLIKDGHENIELYIKEKVKLIMFNLGYLPGKSHNITTKSETTLVALKKSLKLLQEGGVIILVIYHGHKEGKNEKQVLEKFSSNLDQKRYNVIKLKFANQINNPPELICIEKRILL